MPSKLALVVGKEPLFLATWAALTKQEPDLLGVRSPKESKAKATTSLSSSLRCYTLPLMQYPIVYTVVTYSLRVEIPEDEHCWGCLGSWLPQLFSISLVHLLLFSIFGQQCAVRVAILYI